jgi:hypothetical protein
VPVAANVKEPGIVKEEDEGHGEDAEPVNKIETLGWYGTGLGRGHRTDIRNSLLQPRAIRVVANISSSISAFVNGCRLQPFYISSYYIQDRAYPLPSV